jgi:hypothetical protein
MGKQRFLLGLGKGSIQTNLYLCFSDGYDRRNAINAIINTKILSMSEAVNVWI